MAQQWIMIAGPYTTGAESPYDRARNLHALNVAAHQIFQKGHVPIVGVNLVLPIIDAAGPASEAELMMPLSLAAAGRCDAVLRIGGESAGADAEVDVILARGGRVYRSVDEIPAAEAP